MAADDPILVREGDREYLWDFADAWTEWSLPDGSPVPVPKGWQASILRLRDRGLTREHLIESVVIAMRKRNLEGGRSGRFPYFVAVAQNHIADDPPLAQCDTISGGDAR